MPNHPHERTLVIVGYALAMAVVGSTALTLQNFNDGHSVERPQRSDALPDIQVDKVVLASARLSDAVLWNDDHLFVSEPIFEIAGKLQPFESKLPDTWLVQYGFSNADPYIDTHDPDQDLFTNLEEWQSKTDPTSSSSHPPAITKVSLGAIVASDLKLIFRGRVDSNRWQIDLDSTAAFRSQNYLPTVGGTFGPDDRFRLDHYTDKLETDDQGIPHDHSVVTVSYAEAGRADRASVSLVQGKAWELPSHQARFFNPYDRTEFTLKRGETARLKADSGIDYTLTEVTAKGAVFQDQEGRDFEVAPK